MKLPNPRDKMAGCMWLARIVAKARLLIRHELPEEFEKRFCCAGGTDECFIQYFSLSREEILAKAELSDAEIEHWFLLRTPDMQARIDVWNVTAVNLGRPGYPMAERLPIAKATTYKHFDTNGMTTVFEVLEADDKLSGVGN